MQTPTILQIVPELRTGGVERGTLEIAGAIAKAGMRPLVASQGGVMVSQLLHLGAEHITLPLKSKNPFTILRNAKALEAIIREYKVDIIHARSRAPAWSAMLAAKRTNTHFVTTFHGMYGIKPALKKHYNAIMTKGERVIAVSHFVGEHIKQNYKMETEHLRIIHRGVDLALFAPEQVKTQRVVDLASKWRLPDHLPLILMPARITRWKGQHILIEALARLPERNFFCILLGDDTGHENYRSEIERLIAASGLGEHVRIMGNTSFMAEAYMLAEMVVAPSIKPEAFGRVPAEAQAMGKMVIATNHGGAAETIIPNETGFLVTPNDAASLAKTIQHVLQMQQTEKEMIASAAIIHIKEHFSANTMCDKTIQVYKELL